MENIITESGPFVGSAKLVPMDEVFVVRSPGGGKLSRHLPQMRKQFRPFVLRRGRCSRRRVSELPGAV